jgi:hypothetical protein
MAEKQEKIIANEFLEDAVKQMANRATLRDQPQGERSIATTVRAFNALTGHNLSEAEGWEFMILLKMVRGRQGKFSKDDYTDMAAYAGLLGECESTKER